MIKNTFVSVLLLNFLSFGVIHHFDASQSLHARCINIIVIRPVGSGAAWRRSLHQKSAGREREREKEEKVGKEEKRLRRKKRGEKEKKRREKQEMYQAYWCKTPHYRTVK